jgi:hypothetical protein
VAPGYTVAPLGDHPRPTGTDRRKRADATVNIGPHRNELVRRYAAQRQVARKPHVVAAYRSVSLTPVVDPHRRHDDEPG